MRKSKQLLTKRLAFILFTMLMSLNVLAQDIKVQGIVKDETGEAVIGAKAQKGPKWLSNAVFYQIYPSSYMDTDGNGIGDLPGITQKLDYIKSLGVNALWLNPVFESGWFDGGYDVIDYYKVDPRFGTNSDLVTLVSEAHKRGIKVCLDLVAGHTSSECAWFKASAEKDPNGRYSDYFIWLDDISNAEKQEVDVPGGRKDEVDAFGIPGTCQYIAQNDDADRSGHRNDQFYAVRRRSCADLSRISQALPLS